MAITNIRKIGVTQRKDLNISVRDDYVAKWRSQADESSSLLNDYINRRSNNEWMSEDEIENYRSAFERYKSSTSALADLQRNFGNYNEEDEKKRNEYFSTLSTDFDTALDVFGRYKTADSFNVYLQSLEDDKELDNLDLNALSSEIAELEARVNKYDERPRNSSTIPFTTNEGEPYSHLIAPNPSDPSSHLIAPNNTAKFITADAVPKHELETQLSEKKATYNRAKERQDTNRVLAMLEGITDPSSENYDPEYDAYVQKGASIENPSYDKTRAPISVFGWTPFGDGEEVNNPVTFSLDNAQMFASGAATSAGANSLGMDAVVLEMSDEQINNYNYLISKHGKETADIYLEAVRGQIRGKKADEFFEKHLEDKWLAEIMYSTVQGVDQWASGTSALAGSDYADKRLLDPQLIGARAREDLADDSIPVWYNFKESKWEDQIFGSSVGQVVYDFGSTTANMVPSIAIGALSNALIPGSGAYVTTGLMGASAGGNAYKEALNRGYDEGQAQTYGILVGGSEALLQYALGGISKAGGKLSNNVIQKMVSGIDNGFARFALEMGGKMTAEGLEEGLQEILAPFFENLAFQANNDLSDVNWEQAAYSYLLGSLSALGLEGGSAVVNKGLSTIANHKEGKRVIDNGATDSLVALANEMSGVVDTDTAANLSRLAGKVNGKKGVNAKAVGKLSYAMNDVRIQQNKADIVKALEGKGISKNKAAKYADILFEMNEEFFAGKESAFTLGTDEQWKKITGDENAYSVLRNIITDEKSPVNIRNLRYGLSRNGIRVDGEGNVNQEDVENYHTRQLVRAASEGLITSVKNEFDISDNGKTQITESGETVKKRTFVDGEDGSLRLRVNDNSTVDIEDISFGTEDEAIVFSAIVSMGVDAETANAMLSLYKNNGKQAGARFADGINLAFNAGKTNNYSPEILRSIHGLTAQQADAVYKLGRQYALKSAKKAQERVDAQKTKAATSNRGEVIYEGDLADENGELAIKESELKDIQRASLSGIRLLAEISNIRFHIYRSEKMMSKNGKEEFRYVTPDGKTITANGFYITGTNDIYIDLNAGNNGEGTMMYTAAHEIMHFIKDFSPAKFQQIADFLMEEYAKRPNVDVRMLLAKQKDSVKQRADADMLSEQEIDDMAFEEMVCDAMSGMLIDGSFADSMAKLQETNKGLWQTIVDAVAKLLERWGVVVDAYKKTSMNSYEARLVAQMDGAFRKLQQMFAEGMVDAGNAYAQMEKAGSDRFSQRSGFVTDDVIKYSDRSNGKNLVKGKKSRYNEFATIAMQWAYSKKTHSGDNTIIYDGKRKKYILIEAMEEGYFEVAAGTYEEMRSLYERVHREKDRGIYADINTARSGPRSGLWDLQLSQNRGYDVGDAGPSGSQGLQDDSAGSNEHLRGGDQGKSIKTSQRTDGKVMYQERSTALLEKEETRTDYAPVFYSKLERVIDDMEDQKIGADSVIGYLKDTARSISDEEIKQLGIRELLEGKKSVTKQELKDHITENMPRLEEIVLEGGPNATEYVDYEFLPGGSNYRDVLFRVPDSTYSNKTMRGHWKEHAKGILAHTRIQDFIDVYGKRLLFIEEVQSDWYNQKNRMGSEENPADRVKAYKTKKENLEKQRHEDPEKIDQEIMYLQNEYYNILDENNQLEAFPPDNLFGEAYYEYILKRLIRMAAEQGYDSIAWTPARVQTLRWTEDFKEAFHILYDQNMVGFLKRHGKRWGAKVGTTLINTNVEICDVDKLEEYEDTVGDENYNVRVEDIPLTPVEVWNMELTEPMKNAVLYEGQAMFQERSKESATETSENKYSYEALVGKPDMTITTVGGNIPTNRADVVALAKKNAAKVGKTNKDGSVSVHVNDIDTDVILTTHGLRHGLRRKQQMTKANGIVTLMAGQIIRNSIRVNELTPAADDVDSTYILMGIAKDINGYVYIVRSVVNRYDNELVSMDALYAVNAKKELAVQSAPRLAGNPLSVTSSTISIADLLDYVNEYFPDVLPEDVLRHYGHTERPSGDLGGAVLYQQRTSDPTQEKVVQQLEKENAKLVADLAAVKELLALQGKVTGGKMFSKTSLQAVAKRLANKVNANADVTELVELLNDAYGYILTEREASWDGFAEKARPVTAWLARNAQEKKTRTDEAQAALKYIRSKSVYLDEAQKQEVDYIFGSYNDFRKKAMGRITVTDGARVSLDSQWQEFAEMFPLYFDRDVNSADQPLALMEAIDALQNTYDYFGSDMMNEQSLLMDVYDGYWDIATLRTVADKVQKEINLLKAKHRRQMADIRDKHKQADVQLRREYIAKAKRVRENYRKQSEARIEKIAAQYQASRKWGVENRRKTEMRHKIRRVVGELNKLLLHGSKEHNVKISLQKATAEALLAVNMDTVNAEKRLAEIQRKIDATDDPKKIAELQETYNRVELQGENMARKLTALKNAYEEIKDSSDPLVANAYHPEIEERIKNLRKEVGDTPLREMSLEQLENVYDTYRMVLHTIRSANKMFKADKSESIASLAGQVMEEVHSIGGSKAYTIKGTTGIKKFYWNSLKPVYAFKMIGSDTLSALFDNVRAGEDVWAIDVSEAKEYFKSVSGKYGYDSWDIDRQYSFKSRTGKEFSLSIEQIMSLYAYSKRKQADEHIEKGGFVFDGEIEVTQKKFGVPVKYTVNTAAAHNLSRETLGQIINVLSEKQRAFVDEMQAYLSDVMGAKGNEVSLEMFGVELFKEKAYFPLKSAKQFLYEQNEVAGEIRLKNSGFSKETVAHANNPIILSNFMDVWANHVNDMSMYHAFVLPLEDFNRVFNYKTPSAEDLATESVKMYIQNAYGEQPIQYIKQLLTDLNGGARSDPSSDIITRMTSLFKKAAVFSSASVVVQQPSAIARAASMVDSKYFATKLSITQHQKEWAEVKKYAPVAIIKEMGYFDTHMGKSTTDFIKAKSYETLSEKAKGFFADSGYRDEMLSKAPALADELSWCYIWNAVKKEIADTTELAKGSEPFLKKCGERFTEVVVHTQVYDSVLSRSAMMRSKDTGMKMATAFMAEPTTSINMLADAIIQGKRGDKSAAAKTVGAVVASLILNAVLVSFVYAGRDDDEDETYAEKYAGALAGELVDSFNPLTMLPFVKDIVSIAQGYDVERSDMAIISDLFTAFDKLSNDKLPTYRKIEDFGGAIAAMFGLPVKNVMRDIRAMYNTVLMFLNGEETSTEDVVEAVKKEVIG